VTKLTIIVFSFVEYPVGGGRIRPKYVGGLSHVCVLLYVITVNIHEYTWRLVLLQETWIILNLRSLMYKNAVSFIARQIIIPKLSATSISQHKQDGDNIILSYSQTKFHESVRWNVGITTHSFPSLEKVNIALRFFC
jgi:hypothetical protein